MERAAGCRRHVPVNSIAPAMIATASSSLWSRSAELVPITGLARKRRPMLPSTASTQGQPGKNVKAFVKGFQEADPCLKTNDEVGSKRSNLSRRTRSRPCSRLCAATPYSSEKFDVDSEKKYPLRLDKFLPIGA